MKRTQLLAAVLAIFAGAAFAQGPGYGPGYGPGGGWGPGMGGYGGPGMMGGYGPGPGMMGPGYGGGPGYGPGAGRGGYGPMAALNLTDEQRDKLAVIREDHRTKNWDAMGKLRAEQFKLSRLYRAENPDANAVAEQQKKVDELRRAMLKSNLEQRKQMEAILTPEQRKQWREVGPWWMREDSE